MATREELITAARKAHGAGDKAAAKRFLELAAEQKTQVESSAGDNTVAGGMSFINKAIAETVGAPVDLVNFGLSKIGLGSERPFGGSQSIRSGMGAAGIPTPDRPPETAIEYIGQTVGETAAASVPLLRGAQMATRGTGLASRVAAPIVQSAVNAPVRTATVELLGASGAGIGRQFGEEHQLGPGGKLASEFIAGAVPATAAALSPTAIVTSGSKKLGGWALAPFTERGALERASRRMKDVAEDPVKAAANIEDLKGANLSVSAASQDPGLMAIENAVLAENPARATKISRATSEATNDLVNSIRKSGRVSDTRAFISAKMDRLNKAMDARVERAADEANTALSAIGGDEATASMMVRESLESALADAKVQEALLWRAIPADAKASARPVLNKFKEWRNTLSAAQQGDIPPVAYRVLSDAESRGVKSTTIKELDGLYKKLGEEATAARASGAFTQAKIAEDLRDAILQSVDTAEGGAPVREAIDAARSYSRSMNERFRRGAVGKILGFSREGGAKIAPELALKSTIATPGVRSNVAFKEIAEAARFGGRDDATVMEGVQSYLKDRFLQAAVRGGQVDPRMADTFMRSNRDLLTAFPHLRQQLSAARDTADVLRRVEKTTDGFRRALQSPKVSAIARILNAPVDKEISAIMAANNPADTMGRIYTLASKDKTGNAVEGLRSAFSEWLVDEATSGSRIDIAGRNVFHGMKLKSTISKERVANTLQRIFPKKDVDNIKQAAEVLARIEQRAANNKTSPIIEDTPAWLLTIAGRIAGAKAGASLSGTTGGSIQAASIGSSTVKTFLERLTSDKAKQLIVDAFQDKDLMIALLRHRPSLPKPTKARYERAIRAWMVNSGSRLLEPDLYEAAKEEQKKEPQGLIRIRG